ncbi:general stress protein CsbD [Solitalea sp. MAHUQ-68]|uniref:General stress protein CsbD n=1 Tax=Solitalea agri TaxID=2953739 RepID=A0A9X2EYR5_9SPHI|nr:general stress protein CsbD [Solitalea agri]MCO4291467.1 general stress protein CsbD [Solitalea agri]
MGTTPSSSRPTGTFGQQKWSEQKVKLIAKYPVLTDADVHYEQGNKEDMMRKIETKLGKTKEELNLIIQKL